MAHSGSTTQEMPPKGGFKQEMPPKGGYDPIRWFKKHPIKPINGLMLMGAFFSVSAAGFIHYRWNRARRYLLEMEDIEARIALTPFLIAERNRLYLKHIRKTRDEEASLMKDVAGWEVGKWHDYPVFHNPRGLWIDPTIEDFYAHLSRKDKSKHRSVQDYPDF